ncbi:uncharacterized protein LOC142177755 [Nicotiana tabacum]|uniref:Uncharacterized protein LOC142177755 n=1 Tax=Nicotiana tabacum TaxID=4097 RepID=A0AC58U0V8_TOBAC
MIINQFDIGIKVLKTDNGTEFFNSQCDELLASLGIIHQSSCPYTPQQNGIVERKHRHILQLPTETLEKKCPYEMLHNKLAKLDHLRVFSCLYFASNLPICDKFTTRAKKCIIIGYSENQKGYRLYNLDSRKVIVSRDITFREHLFPFKEETYANEDLFPCEPVEASSEETTQLHHSNSNAAANPPALAPAAIHVTEQAVSESLVETSQLPILQEANTNQTESADTPYPISNFITYDHLSENYKSFLGSISEPTEPRSFKEACLDKAWVEAMKAEIKTIEDNATWEVVDLPPGKKVIGSK